MIWRPLSDISLTSFCSCHQRHNDIYDASIEALAEGVICSDEVWGLARLVDKRDKLHWQRAKCKPASLVLGLDMMWSMRKRSCIRREETFSWFDLLSLLCSQKFTHVQLRKKTKQISNLLQFYNKFRLSDNPFYPNPDHE